MSNQRVCSKRVILYTLLHSLVYFTAGYLSSKNTNDKQKSIVQCPHFACGLLSKAQTKRVIANALCLKRRIRRKD